MNEEKKNLENNEEEILNSQENEQIEGGVRGETGAQSFGQVDDSEDGGGCDCLCF